MLHGSSNKLLHSMRKYTTHPVMYTISNHTFYLPECTGTGCHNTHTYTRNLFSKLMCARTQGEIINYQANGHQSEFSFIKPRLCVKVCTCLCIRASDCIKHLHSSKHEQKHLNLYRLLLCKKLFFTKTKCLPSNCPNGEKI